MPFVNCCSPHWQVPWRHSVPRLLSPAFTCSRSSPVCAGLSASFSDCRPRQGQDRVGSEFSGSSKAPKCQTPDGLECLRPESPNCKADSVHGEVTWATPPVYQFKILERAVRIAVAFGAFSICWV